MIMLPLNDDDAFADLPSGTACTCCLNAYRVEPMAPRTFARVEPQPTQFSHCKHPDAGPLGYPVNASEDRRPGKGCYGHRMGVPQCLDRSITNVRRDCAEVRETLLRQLADPECSAARRAALVNLLAAPF